MWSASACSPPSPPEETIPFRLPLNLTDGNAVLARRLRLYLRDPVDSGGAYNFEGITLRPVVAARTGVISAPFELEGDYVLLPGALNANCRWSSGVSTCSGSVSFNLSC